MAYKSSVAFSRKTHNLGLQLLSNFVSCLPLLACRRMAGVHESYIPMFHPRIYFSLTLNSITNLSLTLLLAQIMELLRIYKEHA